jgi:hypothetical protein
VHYTFVFNDFHCFLQQHVNILSRTKTTFSTLEFVNTKDGVLHLVTATASQASTMNLSASKGALAATTRATQPRSSTVVADTSHLRVRDVTEKEPPSADRANGHASS